MLLHQQDGESLGFEIGDSPLHLAHEQWRRLLRGLVQEEPAWAVDQGESDLQLALLPIGEIAHVCLARGAAPGWARRDLSVPRPATYGGQPPRHVGRFAYRDCR